MSITLTKEQRKAVKHGAGPALVQAVPGAGKTTVTEYRYCRLVSKCNVPPDRLLMLTYTRKTEQQLTAQLRGALGRSDRAIQARTFHSWGFAILKRYWKQAGYARKPRKITARQKRAFLEKQAKKLPKRRGHQRPNAGILQRIIERAANTGRSVQSVVQKHYLNHDHLVREIETAARAYRNYKRKKGLVDFEDMLVETERLLASNAALLKKVAKRYRYIMVDEFQDTNAPQVAILRLLGRHNSNILVVGDPVQSIYGYRGATLDNFRAFKQAFPQHKSYPLTKSFRLTQEIAALANAIARHTPGPARAKIQASARGSKPAYVAASSEKKQAAYLCRTIKQLWERDEPLAQMAVLARTHAALLPVQIALRNAGIPYRVAVHEEADVDHIRQVVALLELGANIRNRRALRTVLASFQGVKPSEVRAIVRAVQAKSYQGLYGHSKAACAGDLKRLRAMLKQMNPQMQAEKAVQMAIDCYQPILRRQVKRVAPYLLELGLVTLYARSCLSLEDAVSDLRCWFEAVAPQGRVVLSTMHAAKGLEWNRVFVIGLVDGILPIHHALSETKHLNEERRLWYVAVTRAKRELHLVSAPVKLPKARYRKPSRFIKEIKDFPRLTRSV